MTTASVTIRMDEGLKQDFEEFCTDKGMSMTTAFNIFAKQAVREDRIPFEIKGDRPNDETLEAIQEVEAIKIQEIEATTYSDIQDLINENLDNEA